MLQARERALTPYFVVSILGFASESFQEFGGVSNKVFTPFKDTISKNKIKHVDDVSFHCFTISFKNLF
jgi:hypothetical protein